MFQYYSFNWFQYDGELLTNQGRWAYHTSQLTDAELKNWIKKHLTTLPGHNIVIHSVTAITVQEYLSIINKPLVI